MVLVKKIASYSGHKDCIYVLERGITQAEFFSAGGDGMVVKWDFNKPDQGELIAKVENSIYALAFVPTKNWLIIGQNYKGLHIIDLNNKQEIKNMHFTNAAIFDILVAEDKVFVATGEGKVYCFLLNDFELLTVIESSHKSARCLAYNFHYGQLAIGYSDNYIRIAEGNNILYEILAHSNSVFTLSYNPDGTELLSGSRDAHLKVWEVGNGYNLKKTVVAHMYAINNIVFSPKGKYFATASMDKTLKIWKSSDFTLIKVIDKSRHAGHLTSVNKLLWTDYNHWLVSGSDDRNIAIWEIDLYD